MLTFPALLVGIATLWSNYITPLPPNMFLAVLWRPHVWTWVIAVLIGLLIASYVSWHEQYTLARENSEKPEAVMQVTRDGDFVVTTDRPALGVLMEDVVLPKPQKHMDFARKVLASIVGKDPDLHGDQAVLVTEWKLKFDNALQVVLPSAAGIIHCRVPGVGVGYPDILEYVFGELATSNELEIPLKLSFSNSGPPKRTWHSHYLLTYRVNPKLIGLRHVGIGELAPNKTVCSCCNGHRLGNDRNDLLN